MAEVTMPQLGETVTEGTITKWFKNVGDAIAEDEVLFEVSTDKVDSEVPSPAGGYIAEIKVPEGETVDVGSVLAIIADAPPSGGEAATPEGSETVVPSAAPPPPPPVSAPEPVAVPVAPEPAPVAAEAAPVGEIGNGGGKVLSPVVRRLVNEHGIDPSTIQGTGAGGRVTRADVQAVIDSGAGGAPATTAPATTAPVAPSPAAAPAAAPTPPPVTAVPSAAPVAQVAGERDTTIPHSNIRKRTAEHMVRSLATSAHVYASMEVDYEAVEVVRRANREAFKAEEGFSLTYLPFISRAVVDAIHEFPEVNSTFSDDGLIVHHYLNLGIAVDLDFKGLMVPVIHDADTKRLRAIAREVSDLAARARSKRLSPDEITGGTFTITNPGPYGTLLTLPIINQPQVAILATDGVRRRPVVVNLEDGTEAIAIHSVGNLALTWDHRAFDGAYASAFLNKVREALETRDWAAEL